MKNLWNNEDIYEAAKKTSWVGLLWLISVQLLHCQVSGAPQLASILPCLEHRTDS